MVTKAKPRQSKAEGAPLPIALDRQAGISLGEQIYLQIRALVLEGRLPRAARLPSSRRLADDLGVARATVLNAYEQLQAEDLIITRTGAGSYVTDALADRFDGAPAADLTTAKAAPVLANVFNQADLSGRALALLGHGDDRPAAELPLTPGMPDVAGFPFALWNRLMGRAWRHPAAAFAASAAGHPDLRQAIADYLTTTRGVACGPDQVIITAGAQPAIALCALALAEAGDVAVIEDPGYPGVRGALAGAGMQLAPVPVDSDGLRLDRLPSGPAAKLICVTPSHQFPLGMTLSLSRRLDLLDHARRTGAYVLEDDYDSEYRYAGRPLKALQGLDDAGRVLYIGSFSKVMFPSLRLAYLVAPEGLAPTLARLQTQVFGAAAVGAQAALALFFEEGHFAAHIRRTRKLYYARQQHLLAELASKLPDVLRPDISASGLSLVAHLSPEAERSWGDLALAKRARSAGLGLRAVSAFYSHDAGPQALLLGFAADPPAAITRAVTRLQRAIRSA